MANLLDEFGLRDGGQAPTAAPGNLLDEFGIERPKSSLLRRGLGDTGISLLKGAISVPEAIVGLADIPTGGIAGKAAEQAGFRPKEAKATLDEYLSPEQKAANAKVQAAEGFFDTTGAMLENPSTILQTGLESVPAMLGGGVVARGARALPGIGQKLAPWVAGAIGEGTVSAGMSAEQVRQQTEDGLLTAGQSGLSALTGFGTGLIGAGGAKLANKLGVGEIDTLLAGGTAQASGKGIARRAAEGAAVEGVLQELPQSAQEQALQNIALDRPWNEGIGEAAAAGLLTGGVLGGIAGPLGGRPVAPEPVITPVIDPSAGVISRAASLAPSAVADVTRASLLNGAPGQGQAGKYTPADLETAVAQQLFSSELDADGKLVYSRYNPDLQVVEAVDQKTVTAAAKAHIKQASELGFDPLDNRSLDQLLPTVEGERGPQGTGQAADDLSPYERNQLRATGVTDEQLASMTTQQARQAPGLPTVDFDSGPQTTEEINQPLPLATVDFDSGPQSLKAVEATAADPLAITFKGVPGAKKALNAMPDADLYEVTKTGDKQWRIQAKAPAAPKRSKVKVDREHDSLSQAVIRLGGLKTAHRQDTTGDSKGNKQVPGVGALWSDKTGTGLDDMASLLDQNGYVPAGEMDNLGGVPWLQAALRDEVDGRKTHYAPGSARQESESAKAEAERYSRNADRLPGDDLEGRLDAAFDLTEEVAALEARRIKALRHAQELDALFGDDTDGPDIQAASPREADPRAEQAPRPAEPGSDSARSEQPDQGSRAEAPRDTPAEPLELTQQTEQDLAEQAASQAAAAAKQAAKAKTATDKAQADKDRNDFNLTGSDRTADMATAAGQTDIFAQPAADEKAPAAPASIEGADIDGDWAQFSKGSSTLGIPRADMPQIQAEHRGAMVNFLNARDISHETETVPAVELKPTQAEFSRKKVAKAKAFDGGDRSILISRDGHVLDGHHQWLARRDAGEDVKVIRLDAPIKKLLGEVAEFPSAAQDDASGAAPAQSSEPSVNAPRGSYTAADDKASARQFVSEPTTSERGYETDLFGNPVQALKGKDRPAKSRGAGLPGVVQPAASVPGDTPTPAGKYHVRTVVGSEIKRRLGTDRINSFADLAQATQYLYRSAVERFDGIVTDKNGRPLAVVGGFKGAIDSASVPMPTVIAEAVRVPGAANIWFSHNHPSGESGLSQADRTLYRALKDAFDGSGIEPQGLIAVGRGTYDSDSYAGGQIPSGGKVVSVPVMEREQVGGPLRDVIDSPAAAVSIALAYHADAGSPGMILLNSKHYVTGWVPFSAAMTEGPLRNTGGLNAIYRAVSEGNVAAAILVHSGELDNKLVADHDAGMNIAAALSKAGVRPLDVIDVTKTRSRAESGKVIAGSALYRLSDTQAKGIPLFSARAMAGKIAKTTGLKVETVANEDGLPDAVQAQIKRDGVSGRVAGVYHNGTSYLIASNLRDTQHAISTVLHEAVGHGGVKAVLGSKIAGTMRQIYRDIPSALRSELERRYAGQTQGLSQDDAQALIAEEYVAHLAETDPKHGIIGRLVAMLRQFIRSTFGDAAALKWTRGDLVQLLAEARQAAGRDGNDGGNRYSAAEEVPLPQVSEASEADFVASLTGSNAFARAIYKAQGTDSPFFQRWFGKSRMVDKQGRPVAFVHRSYGERDTFSDADLGGNTGTPTAALGHYLARKDVGNVERYGPVTEQFYIRMNKPKVVTQDQFEAMGDWSLTKVKAYRTTLMQQGHDGLYIQGLAWPVVFEGKNIKAARNSGTFDESDSTRYSLADDARSLFDRTAGPAPLERDDPFAAENRRLREGEKTLWQKAKKQFARQFAPGGLLPDAVFDEKITRDSEFQAVEFDVRHLSMGLSKAVKADFGVDLDNLTAEQMKPLAEALSGKVDPAIPEATKVAIVSMRQYIDSLSGEYLNIIQGQIDAHQEKSATYGPALKAANDARKALTAAIASSSDPAITQAAAAKKAALAAQVKAKKAMDGLKGDERATAKAAYEVAVKAHDKARSELRAALSPALKAQLKEVDALRATANDARSSTAEAKAEAALYEKIAGNLGAYVNRSYQAFDDPKWFKTVPTEVVNTARTYLANGYIEQGETAAEAARLADVTVNEMLKNGTAYDSMGGFIAEGKLGAKDLTVLIKRKEIAPEIRALLGEYMDPRLNFAKSATKMGRLVWNQRFLDRVLSFGMGTFLFEGKDRPADATTQIAGEQSETYAPLNGLWTFPEVAQSFKDALGKEQMSDLYRTVVRLNGMVKYGKTILSPTTAMRNWQSAMFFSLANGHFDLTQMKKSWAAMREQVTQNATGDDLAYLRKLKQLGVVYDTPYAGEMMALLQDARMDELLSSKSGTGLKWLRKANQFAQGFYSFGDDFWKIIGYENEKAGLLQAGIPLAEAETMAAKRIRDTYPTYSMIGKAVQWLRRFPLAGTFVSFPSEIIRTTVNMMQLTAADMKSDNPGLRALGRKRAAGMALVSGGFYALAAMTAAAFGVGDDEEEALRDLAAPWSKNSTFLYTGRDADGKLRYFDMSFLDPYGYWKRPLTAMMRDQPWEDSAASGISDMLSPFFGADISAGAIFEVLANKKPTGGQVYNEHAGSVDQLQDIADHMRKALQPGFVSNAERLYLAGTEARREGSGQPYSMRDEAVSLLGWRAATLDTQTGLYYRSFDFSDALSDARKTLTRTLRSSNSVSEGDIRDSKRAAEAQYQKAFTEMGRLVSAAEVAGMSRGEIVKTLKLSGVAQRNIFALISGRVPPMDISMQAQAKAVRQARVMRDSEHAAEIARRFRLARE